MKPPIKGASKGPLKTATEKTVTAMPLVLLLNMSAKTAPTHVSGHAPMKPLKNRQMKTVWASLPTATATLKMEKAKEDMIRGSLRPYNSENGAHTIGPRANLEMLSASVFFIWLLRELTQGRIVRRPRYQLLSKHQTAWRLMLLQQKRWKIRMRQSK